MLRLYKSTEEFPLGDGSALDNDERELTESPGVPGLFTGGDEDVFTAGDEDMNEGPRTTLFLIDPSST